MNQEVETQEKFMTDLQNTQKMCQALMQTPHYRKLGPEGIFAVVEKAKALGINPMSALNGSLYYVKGKVEMTSSMMGSLIRARNHSYTRARESDDTICILHGRRCDTGDTWTESFSIDDARRAGIYNNAWKTYPRDMLYARALSRLARQLFPDVINGCYVSGEISESPAINDPIVEDEYISEEEAEHIVDLVGDNDHLKSSIINLMQKDGCGPDFKQMKRKIYEKVMPTVQKMYDNRTQQLEAKEEVA